jgi:hypothetical protein
MDIGYRKEYKLRKLVKGRKYISTGVPYEVVEREAARRNMTVDDFIIQFIVVAEYDNFEGLRYTFKPAQPPDDGKKPPESAQESQGE